MKLTHLILELEMKYIKNIGVIIQQEYLDI